MYCILCHESWLNSWPSLNRQPLFQASHQNRFCRLKSLHHSIRNKMWSNYLEQNVQCVVQHGPVGQNWSMKSVGTAVQKRHRSRARALLCGLKDTRDGDDPPKSDPFVFHIHRTSWLLPQKLSRQWLFDHTHTQLHFDPNTQAVHQKVRSQSSQSRGLWLKKSMCPYTHLSD